ncbi:hypothetical protein PInf_012704 [Phytophthora infestans]|nr:hypothetical protein PInf_012704 [Phytophthora infestans]
MKIYAFLAALSSVTIAAVEEETKTLAELYADAIAEGGNLIIKYHDVRIDNQLETDTLVPDVVALQTLQDFTRWAKTGDLLCYKPKGFSEIYDALKDSSGAWMAYSIFTFGFVYDSSALNGTVAPTSPADLTDSGKIASSYPHDDDAVLFLYTRYVEKYGWDWVAKMAQQNIDFNRGSNVASDLVLAGSEG